MAIDFEAMTLSEVEEIELLTGRSIETIMNEDAPRGRALKAIIWVLKKRQDPSFTLEQAGKLSLKDAAQLFQGDEADPKD
jgi:hypothetical protein